MRFPGLETCKHGCYDDVEDGDDGEGVRLENLDEAQFAEMEEVLESERLVLVDATKEEDDEALWKPVLLPPKEVPAYMQAPV